MINLIEILAKRSKINIKKMQQNNGSMRTNLYKRIDFIDKGDGGSPTVADLNFLSLLTSHFKPQTVFEVGCWLGCSSTAMALNGAKEVYTCDRYDRYRNNLPNVHFAAIMSDRFLKKMSQEGRCCQFAFIDANLSIEDAAALLSFFQKGRELIAIHDMQIHNGIANLVKLTCRAIDCNIFMPDFDKPVDIDGVKINDFCGLVMGREIANELGL